MMVHIGSFRFHKSLQEFFAMLRAFGLVAIAGVCLGLHLLTGCSQQANSPAEGTAVETHDHGSVDPKIEESLSQLPADLHELAHAQQTCPVTGEPLGSMGVPAVVEVQGKRVLLCCEHCQEPIQQDPEKYLAKLNPTPEGDHVE
jgi:hypothetical protein